MPTYTLTQLQTLASSELVASPDFKWNDWESVFRSRRRSSVANRPELELKKKTVEFNEEELENDPDKAMAAFFLRKNPNPSQSQAQKEQSQPLPVVQDSAIEEVEEDGWTSVVKPRKRGMSRNSFSKWSGRS